MINDLIVTMIESAQLSWSSVNNDRAWSLGKRGSVHADHVAFLVLPPPPHLGRAPSLVLPHSPPPLNFNNTRPQQTFAGLAPHPGFRRDGPSFAQCSQPPAESSFRNRFSPTPPTGCGHSLVTQGALQRDGVLTGSPCRAEMRYALCPLSSVTFRSNTRMI